MATENKGVMVYLPSEIEKAIEQYCIENNITRKNKDGVFEGSPSLKVISNAYLNNWSSAEII